MQHVGAVARERAALEFGSALVGQTRWGQCAQWPVTKPGRSRLAARSEARGSLGSVRFPFFFGADPWWLPLLPGSLAGAFHGQGQVPHCFLLHLPAPSPPPSSLPLSRLSLSRKPQVGRMPIFL